VGRLVYENKMKLLWMLLVTWLPAVLQLLHICKGVGLKKNKKHSICKQRWYLSKPVDQTYQFYNLSSVFNIENKLYIFAQKSMPAQKD